MARAPTDKPRTRKRKRSRPRVRLSEFRDGVRTLDHWRKELRAPRTIECQEIRLLGRGFEETVISGPGRIQLVSESEIRFWVYGEAEDGVLAFRKLVEAQNNPYDGLAQFRLQATDYRGQEWTGGYTAVDYFADANRGWPLTGVLQGLSTTATGPSWVAKESSVELLLIPPVDLPLGEWSETAVRLRDKVISYSRSPGGHVVRALGTRILFEMDPAGDALWITAKTNKRLRHPFAERWLAEPLRILLGALIYPRLMARNSGDGRSSVTVLPAPKVSRPTALGLRMPFSLEDRSGEEFWKLYAAILTMIGKAEADSMSLFNGHPVTRLYEELAQADAGSRWVLLLTLASTAEALAKSIMNDRDRKSEFPKRALESMEAHLGKWGSHAGLRDRMLSNLANVRKRSVQGFMKRLADKEIIERSHLNTWVKLRNSVMHGELVEPWATEEGDQHLSEMVALVHALTRKRIAKG